MSEISNIILEAIEEAIEKYLLNMHFDKTIRGKIVKNISKDLYSVLINGNEYEVCTSNKDMELKINEDVWITIPQNNWNNIFILSVIPNRKIIP